MRGAQKRHRRAEYYADQQCDHGNEERGAHAPQILHPAVIIQKCLGKFLSRGHYCALMYLSTIDCTVPFAMSLLSATLTASFNAGFSLFRPIA